MVELPLDALVTGAVNASVGAPSPGSNSTVAYPITSDLLLPANGTASQFVNTTITSITQVNHPVGQDHIREPALLFILACSRIWVDLPAATLRQAGRMKRAFF